MKTVIENKILSFLKVIQLEHGILLRNILCVVKIYLTRKKEKQLIHRKQNKETQGRQKEGRKIKRKKKERERKRKGEWLLCVNFIQFWGSQIFAQKILHLLGLVVWPSG